MLTLHRFFYLQIYEFVLIMQFQFMFIWTQLNFRVDFHHCITTQGNLCHDAMKMTSLVKNDMMSFCMTTLKRIVKFITVAVGRK